MVSYYIIYILFGHTVYSFINMPFEGPISISLASKLFCPGRIDTKNFFNFISMNFMLKKTHALFTYFRDGILKVFPEKKA